MSVYFMFARLNNAVQCVTDSTGETSIRKFSYVEIHSSGWVTGSRTRSRKFHDFHRAFAYVNKLYEGSWISDMEYARVWRLLTEIQTESGSVFS